MVFVHDLLRKTVLGATPSEPRRGGLSGVTDGDAAERRWFGLAVLVLAGC